MSSALGSKINLPLWTVDLGAVGAGATADTRGLSIAQYTSGRITGSLFSSAAVTFDVFMDSTMAAVSTGLPTWVVPQDGSLPGFQYPFSIQVFEPFVRFRYTVGGAPATFLRVNVQAIPQ